MRELKELEDYIELSKVLNEAADELTVHGHIDKAAEEVNKSIKELVTFNLEEYKKYRTKLSWWGRLMLKRKESKQNKFLKKEQVKNIKQDLIHEDTQLNELNKRLAQLEDINNKLKAYGLIADIEGNILKLPEIIDEEEDENESDEEKSVIEAEEDDDCLKF